MSQNKYKLLLLIIVAIIGFGYAYSIRSYECVYLGSDMPCGIFSRLISNATLFVISLIILIDWLRTKLETAPIVLKILRPLILFLFIFPIISFIDIFTLFANKTYPITSFFHNNTVISITLILLFVLYFNLEQLFTSSASFKKPFIRGVVSSLLISFSIAGIDTFGCYGESCMAGLLVYVLFFGGVMTSLILGVLFHYFGRSVYPRLSVWRPSTVTRRIAIFLLIVFAVLMLWQGVTKISVDKLNRAFDNCIKEKIAEFGSDQKAFEACRKK